MLNLGKFLINCISILNLKINDDVNKDLFQKIEKNWIVDNKKNGIMNQGEKKCCNECVVMSIFFVFILRIRVF